LYALSLVYDESTMDKDNSGQSFVEILLIIAIIIIIAGFGASAFRQYLIKNRLTGAAKEIVSDLRSMQQNTVTQQVVYGIEFIPPNTYFYIRYAEDPYNPGTLIKEQYAQRFLLYGITIDTISGFTDNIVVFNAGAGVSESGAITLTDGNLTVTIEVRPSGFVDFRF